MDSPVLVSNFDEIGNWSEYIKYEFLKRYLPEHTKILHSYRHYFPGGFHYIDAFAGSGMPKLREEGRFVKGSPRIALDLACPYDSYTFIEKTIWRADRLRNLMIEYPDRKITVIQDDCNTVLQHRIALAFRPALRVRGFVFLDPFGMELDWATIEAIGRTGTLEIILNLPTMAFNRGALHRGIDSLTEQDKARMTRCWGSDEWLDYFYQRRDGLWGAHFVKVRATGADILGQLFRERLESIFNCVTDPYVVRNNQGTPIYCLLFAGPNQNGAKIASHILQRCLNMPSVPPPVQQPLAMLF